MKFPRALADIPISREKVAPTEEKLGSFFVSVPKKDPGSWSAETGGCADRLGIFLGPLFSSRVIERRQNRFGIPCSLFQVDGLVIERELKSLPS